MHNYLVLLFVLLLTTAGSSFAETHQSHAIAMHGEPQLPADFKHFDYVRPDAPKGGTLRLALQGNYDSLNQFIAKGNAADHLNLIYDTLTTASGDEAFTEYGLLAERIEWPDDRSWVKYTLRSNARFHDGHPITADDVVFTFNLLMEHGSPAFKSYYREVSKVSKLSIHEVRFDFSGSSNRELALIVGQLPVLPAHYWKTRDFSQGSMDFPLGSGPYRITAADPGKSIRFERVADYWGKDLPVNRGMYNFDHIQLDYYRDGTVLLEALKAHKYDIRRENIAKQWATGYNGPAISSGKLKTEEIPHSNPAGMQSFVLNLRNPLFSDSRVRKALAYAFDFEWSNNALFYNSYKRSYSFFSNSELAATGLPSGEELKLLNPLKTQIPASVFSEPFTLPQTDGSGNNRAQLRMAKQLLQQAGWQTRNNQLVNADGKVFRFEFLVYDAAFIRIINPYIQNLKRLGIETTIRQVEISQYINQMRNFTFDVASLVYPQSLSPGNEQFDYWHSSSADQEGSRNYGGIKNPAIDKLVEHVINARDRDSLITATRALDRVLLHNWYVIPQFYLNAHRVAYWDKFGKPAQPPKHDYAFTQHIQTWWALPEK